MTEKQNTHLKVGDRVQVIAGNQKGLLGNIVTLNFKKATAILDSIKPRKKRNKKTQEEIDLQIPIHVSNIMLWDTTVNKASRVGYKFQNDEKKRYFKKSGNTL